jgi:acyl-[acyl-carrier-protein]-phospholipid O-acyltransferase/long-chain-fatty-acid--[acyl-carrier-protein] ligase
MIIGQAVMKGTLVKLGRSFAWFNVTQFLGALNDNIFKLLLILFLIGVKGPENATRITALAGAIVVVPFLLFSAYAGRLADYYSKRDIIVYTKFAELAIMLLGCVAFLAGNEITLYIVLFLTSLQSAFFGPSKYGIIRELSGDARLTKANSIIQACTYVAIIIGTALGPFLSGILKGHFLMAAVFCVAVSAAGVISSLLIERTAPAQGSGKTSLLFIKDIWQTLYSIRQNRPLLWSVLGAAYFSLFGAFIYLNIIPYGLEHLSLTKEQSGYLFVVAGIGVAAGSLWSGKISGRGIELGTIPVSAAGLVVCMAALGTISANLHLALGFVLVLGISAGLYIVPIRAFIQLRSPTNRRAEIIAASSFLSWCGVLGASGFIYMLSHLFGLSAANIFIVLCAMALIPAAVTFILLFEYLVRFVVSRITRIFYKINVHGAENIPPTGGVLIICNHASYADPSILEAAQDRSVCFVMYRSFYNLPFLKPVCKLCRTVPISGKDSFSQTRGSIRQARELLKQGRIVCIFPEGGMTRNGNLRAFKNGYELIVKGIDCRIIPTYIGGTWKSFMSYYYGKPLSHLPRRFRPSVSVHFGRALSRDVTLGQLRQYVTELSCDYYNCLKSPKSGVSFYTNGTAKLASPVHIRHN